MDNREYKIDKETDLLFYNDESHVYIDKCDYSKYISCTTLIGRYEIPFDGDFWSSYKALEIILLDRFYEYKKSLLETKKFNSKILKIENITIEEFNIEKQKVLDSYEESKRVACERGTAIHAEFELENYKLNGKEIPEFGLKGEFQSRENYYTLNLEKGIYPEYLVGFKSNDGIVKIAGQVDLLIKDGNDIYIYDYKTSKKIDKKSYYDPFLKSSVKMKKPLYHLDDCNFIHYSLQMSLYAYLVQQINPELNIKKLVLIHIDHDGNKIEIPCKYLKEEVIKMIAHYKRGLISQQD